MATCPGRERLTLGVQNSIRVSLMHGRTGYLGPPAFLGAQQGDGLEVEPPELKLRL